MIEKEKAKKIVGKDGLCFRVIYGGGNVLEALMKGSLLPQWWEWIKSYQDNLDLSPLLYRLAEELPLHACVTKGDRLLSKATEVIINKRDEQIPDEVKKFLLNWLDAWEDWVNNPNPSRTQEISVDDHSVNKANDNLITNKSKDSLGTTEKDLANILRFSAFWLDKMQQHQQWTQGGK